MKNIDADKNALVATKILLDFSKVPVTRLGLQEALWQHPDFPSLNALSDVLNDFQVPNLSTRLTPDRLHEIPLPALTYLNIDGGIFAPLRNVNGNVEWLHTQRGWQKESLGQFSQKWSGITLLIEPNEQSGERDYTQNRHRETLGVLRVLFIVGAILAILGLVVSSALQVFPWAEYSAYYLIGLSKLAGTIVSGMLVWYSIDANNEFLQRICQTNGRTNCQSVLNSSAAKLTDWLSWAEVGLFYFAGGLLTVMVGLSTGNSSVLIPLTASLYLLTLMALPYTVWSVYFQWRVARKWCVMCLIVQALLWVEFSIAFKIFGALPLDTMLPISSSTLLIFTVCFLLPIAFWGWSKHFVVKSLSYDQNHQKLQKVKFDPSYLNAVLGRQQQMPLLFDGMNTVKLGSVKPEHIITVVTNLFCSPCARNHKKMSSLLSLSDHIQCQIIFIGPKASMELAGKIMSVAQEAIEETLASWFENINQDEASWLKRRSIADELSEETQHQLHLYTKWCELAGIEGTPKIFMNGISLPPDYSINDMPALVRVLDRQQSVLLT